MELGSEMSGFRRYVSRSREVLTRFRLLPVTRIRVPC